MLSSLFSVVLLSITALAAQQGKRQATNAAQFTSAADQLISQYIPSTALPALESAVSVAASAASVAGSPLSLIYDGLLAISMPGWFSSAIPSDMSTQIFALESKISALRATSTAGGITVIVITTTNLAGSTITTSTTSTVPSTTVTSTTTSGVTATTTATTTTGSGSGAGSTLSTLTTEVINGATSVFSVAVSGASSVASRASSVVSVGTSAVKSATSAAGGASPTHVPGCAAGVIGLLGLMVAL